MGDDWEKAEGRPGGLQRIDSLEEMPPEEGGGESGNEEQEPGSAEPSSETDEPSGGPERVDRPGDAGGEPAEPEPTPPPRTKGAALHVRVPTGIESLDSVFDGGVPAGSVILLLSDIGAGGSEFAYSSLFFLSDVIREGAPLPGDIKAPRSIAYITITRMKEEVVRDITLSFKPALSSHILDVVTFHDLSDIYFEKSVVPAEWYSGGDALSRFQTRGREHASILAELSGALSRTEPGSLIIIDSLTDLAPQFDDRKKWNEFIAFLRGLQRVSKEWGSNVYLHLTSRILPPERETEVADCADALIAFRWEDAGAGRRQRVMFFEKFRGVMPHLEENDLVKFAVGISAAGGFEVSNIRVVI